MKKDNLNSNKKDIMDAPNMAEMDFWLSSVIGAMFFYCINFGQKSFKELNDEQFIKRNAFTGWLLSMIVIFGGLFLIIKLIDLQ